MKVLALLLALAAPASADDWYVDPVNGSNTNTGTSPTDAWATITYAVGQTPAGPQTVHLAPGFYLGSNGEAFPIDLPHEIELRGPEDPSSAVVLTGMRAFEHTADTVDEEVTLRSFTIRNAAEGLYVRGITVRIVTTVEDMRFEDCTAGIDSLTSWFVFQGSPIIVRRSVFTRCADAGITAGGSALHPANLTVEDSVFRDCGIGAEISEGLKTTNQADVRRCDVRGCGTGLRCGFGNRMTAEDCVVVGNDTGILSGEWLDVRRSTIADNAIVGIEHLGFLDLVGSIVDGQPIDVGGPMMYRTAVDNLIGDGTDAGSGGNFVADPGFVDRAQGDYRLGPWSAALDRVAPTSGLDVMGSLRGDDADLDTQRADDLGAYERKTVEARQGGVSIGSGTTIRVAGEPGCWVSLWLSREGLQPAITTPLGDLWLQPGTEDLIGTALVGGDGFVEFTVDLPDDPTLVGMTIGVQGVARSMRSPSGAARSAATSFLVVD